MASEGNPVSGGVTLLHTECEGKHSYEVKGFLNYNKGMFTSKGDKLLMINNINVEDLTPEAFADLLLEGSPLLTIHHPCKTKTEECESEELRVNKKEPMLMSFSLMMVRESELEAYGSQEPSPSQPEGEDIEDDTFDDENLLIVSMVDTSFSLVLARGCDPDNPCNNCGKTNCKFNEVVVLPASAAVTSGSPRKLCLLKQKENLYIKSFFTEKYVTPYNHQICLDNTMSAPITIYSYTITMDIPGTPVVLNFTNTENFFRCTTKQGVDTKILTVTQYKKKDLQTICADEPEKWSLVFYMSCGADNLRRFESALHRGWFIYTKNVDQVDMQRDEQFYCKPNNFFIIIHS
ncbi:interleukin-1 family member A [Rhinichthys klamathensis goyatoka]|uniref:interleukin-1 family member A n=1 Tax=Rhinichthys klamathensis goyatoka TaxID=3034132 RepID=UPI0024B4A5A8|nr:interleukin-1 family member A [Rhinichthys klamathensis goyatoka]